MVKIISGWNNVIWLCFNPIILNARAKFIGQGKEGEFGNIIKWWTHLFGQPSHYYFFSQIYIFDNKVIYSIDYVNNKTQRKKKIFSQSTIFFLCSKCACLYFYVQKVISFERLINNIRMMKKNKERKRVNIYIYIYIYI